MIIIGIDPGISGAISILENKKILEVYDTPTMIDGKKNKRQINSAQVTNIIKERLNADKEVVVVVEQVNAMPGQGVTSMFNFGQSFGVIKGICAALSLPIPMLQILYHLVSASIHSFSNFSLASCNTTMPDIILPSLPTALPFTNDTGLSDITGNTVLFLIVVELKASYSG